MIFLKAHSLAHDWNVHLKQGGTLQEVCTHLVYLQLYFLNNIQEIHSDAVQARYPIHDTFIVLLRTPTDRGLITVNFGVYGAALSTSG